jgi:hypothetical protein
LELSNSTVSTIVKIELKLWNMWEVQVVYNQ